MSEKTRSKKKPAKKQKKGIDMSHVPKCLVDEGYTQSEPEIKGTPKEGPQEVPDCLKCPVCKELLINPEMYPCGHTLCKFCVDNNRKNECAVCKTRSFQQMIPNYALRDLIEMQFPKESKKKKTELEEIANLAKKLEKYRFASRYRELFSVFESYMEQKRYIHFTDLVEYFTARKNFKPAITEQELQYFVSIAIVHPQSPILRVVGQYLVWGMPGDTSSLLDWLDKNKTATNKNWIPVIILSLLTYHNCTNLHEKYQRLAKIYKIEIGEQLSVDGWRSQPAYWLKDIDLGPVDDLYFHSIASKCSIPSSDEEDYSSSDDFMNF